MSGIRSLRRKLHYFYLLSKEIVTERETYMDYEFMKHVNQLAIDRELEEIKKIKRRHQEEQDKRDAVKAIAVIIGAMLFVGFMGG